VVCSGIVFFCLLGLPLRCGWTLVFVEGLPEHSPVSSFQHETQSGEGAGKRWICTNPKPNLLQERQCWKRLASMQKFVLIHQIFHCWVSKQLTRWPSSIPVLHPGSEEACLRVAAQLTAACLTRQPCWYRAYCIGDALFRLHLEQAIAWHRNITRYCVLEQVTVQNTV